MQTFGDSIGDGDHQGAAGNEEALQGGDKSGPGTLSVGNADGVLVRVVDQHRARRTGAEPPWREHRRVVRVDRVRPQAAQRHHESREEDEPIEKRGKAPTDPGGWRHRPRSEAVERAVELAPHTWQVQHRDFVASLSQRPRRPPDPRVVLDRLVEQHRDPHSAAQDRDGRGRVGSRHGQLAAAVYFDPCASPS